VVGGLAVDSDSVHRADDKLSTGHVETAESLTPLSFSDTLILLYTSSLWLPCGQARSALYAAAVGVQVSLACEGSEGK